MAKVVIDGGNPRVDGEYELEEGFNGHELRLIKQISGVRVGELEDAIDAGDYDVVIAIASIALRRRGEKVPEDVLLELPFGAVRLEATEAEENDAGPPAQTPSGGPGNVAERPPSSGEGLSGSSESPATSPNGTGDPTSAIGSASGRAI